MKKRKLNNYSKLGILLIGILFIFSNCELEEETFIQKETIFKTVSKIEAINYLDSFSKQNLSNKISNQLELNYDSSLLQFEPIINSKEYLAVIPANTIHKAISSRILLFKYKDQIQSVLFNMYPSEISNNNLFSGIIIITDLNGNFINGYRVKNSKFITQFFLKSTNKNSKSFRTSEIDCGCGNGEFCLVFTQNLNEITINANSSNLISPVNLWGLISNISSFVIINESPFWDWDGGGSPPQYDPPVNTECVQGYIKDLNGNCVPIPCDPGYVKDINGNCVKPCMKVYNLMNDPKTNAIYDILATKIKESIEYGYSKKLDGNWIEGALGNNGHSIEIGSSNVGFLHTHTYNTGSIHMFSDTDIIKFLFQVRYAVNNGLDMSEVIGGMVSDSGTYVMSYNGVILYDLAALNGWTEDKMRKEYRKAYRMSDCDMTKLFYDFINKLGIKGITLNERQNDGTYKKTILNSDGTTKKEDC